MHVCIECDAIEWTGTRLCVYIYIYIIYMYICMKELFFALDSGIGVLTGISG